MHLTLKCRCPHCARPLFRLGWSCLVEQGHYGHPAPKATLLYFVGPGEPPRCGGDRAGHRAGST